MAEVYTGANAPLVLSRDDRMFRTRLREASKGKPNFAGHYILTAWGCGTTCLMGGIIDARTGKVYWWNFTICCWSPGVDDKFEPIEFRLNSRLIIFSGDRNEKEGDSGTHFYKFQNGRFIHLRSVSKAGSLNQLNKNSSSQILGAPEMTKWVGKYPDTKFFSLPQLKNPLRRILSKEDFDSLSDFNLMSPIQRVGDYLVTNSSIKYSIPTIALNVAFSLQDGSVYVVFWKDDQHRKFSTNNNRFDLPEDVMKELGL